MSKCKLMLCLPVLFFMLCMTVVSADELPYKVVAYAYKTTSGFDASLVTNVHYAFADIKDGCISLDSNDISNLTALCSMRSQYPNLKVVLAVGGASRSYYFSETAATDASRKRFAESCREAVASYGLDGVDIDWEYPTNGMWGEIPSSAEDKHNFTLLMREIRESVGADCIVSAAIGSYTNFQEDIELENLAEIVDYIGLMNYDFTVTDSRHHANLYASDFMNSKPKCGDLAVKTCLESGVPASKIIFGIPFYGRSAAGAISYKSLKEGYIDKNGYTRCWDDNAKAAYLVNGDNFITYEDSESIWWKADYIRRNELGGAMYWSYSDDDSEKTLSTAVYYTLCVENAADFTIEKTATNIGVYESTSIVITALNGELLNNGLFTYDVSDSKTARVSEDGVITGLSPGCCVVSVSTPYVKKSIVVTVRHCSSLCLQGFEGNEGGEWWTSEMSRSGEKSCLISESARHNTSFSLPDTSERIHSAWSPQDNAVIEAWFYDDTEYKQGYVRIRVANQSYIGAPEIIRFRINAGDNKYSVSIPASTTDGFVPSDLTVEVSDSASRTTGWHQVVFDLSKANLGDGSGTRRVYLDGEVIYQDSYTFNDADYLKIGAVYAHTDTDYDIIKMYFDDFNAFCVQQYSIETDDAGVKASSVESGMTLVAALYDEDGLVELKMSQAKTDGEFLFISIDSSGENTVLKTFLWDGIEKMHPIPFTVQER